MSEPKLSKEQRREFVSELREGAMCGPLDRDGFPEIVERIWQAGRCGGLAEAYRIWDSSEDHCVGKEIRTVYDEAKKSVEGSEAAQD